MTQQQVTVLKKERTRLSEPGDYQVIFLNDDVTTMDFVVLVLEKVFFYNKNEATSLMLEVHTKGKAVVGVYTYDLAMSKTALATNMAREAGFPLHIICQPE